MHPIIKCSISIFTITYIVAKLYLFRIKNEEESRIIENRKDICEVLFTNPSSKCCLGYRKNRECLNTYCAKKSVARVVHFIDGAQISICVAMNIFTHRLFCEALVHAQQRGVLVRVLLDCQMAVQSSSKQHPLKQHGVTVRFYDYQNNQGKSGYTMHHKFCLIDVLTAAEQSVSNRDSKGIAIFGSLNWTGNAFMKNWENFIISSQQKIARDFRNEYEGIWNLSEELML